MQFKENYPKTQIQRFYADQNILITGGTGFLGKLLIEKLLRRCHELASIYVIIRRKKDQTVQERFQHLLEQQIFNPLKSEFPQILQKVIPIEGDCSQPSLGLSEEDIVSLQNKVSIVFHVAASVRFNDKLKKAVADNVIGTKEIIDLCQSMTNLKAFIHVSTIYAHSIRTEIDENFYNPPITGDRILRMSETLNAEEFDKLENTLRKNYPNNYCFTKAVAEQLVQQHAKNLPTGVFRPAIVSSTYREPIEGWSDNFSGSNGLVASAITGLLKVLHGDKSKKADIVPADLTINALIATAWDVALNKTRNDEPFVYNYISNWSESITWGEYYSFTQKYETPLLNSIWINNVMFVKYSWAYYIFKNVLQTMPAFATDSILKILGRKTWAVMTNKKLESMIYILSTFTLNEWRNKNERIQSLWKKVSPDDQNLFPFSMNNFDWQDYMQKFMIGLRIYLLKDPLDTVPAARRRRLRFLILHKILKYTLSMLILLMFYKVLT